ncbi:MAG: hypothetical protein KGS45_00610 [Planctomycetes bacterium]|nr:hypothetical protein [Planctomycetota bacterium]
MSQIHLPAAGGVMRLGVLGVVAAGAMARVPWPAESWGASVNLTGIEGAGTNDFYQDLSAAVWDGETGRLWVARNGPTPNSKLWALRQSGSTWVVDTQSSLRGEWTGLGDLEAVTLCPQTPSVVYCASEGEQVIRALSVSTYGTVTILRQWNVTSAVPASGGDGIEGLTFVPNWALEEAGFAILSGGAQTRSTLGLGGLFFVGNQIDGRIYVLDLSPSGASFTWYGSLATNYPEIAELTFDASTRQLLILHGDNQNRIEVCALTATGTGTSRRLTEVQTIERPTGSATNANIEGLAILDGATCSTGNGAHAGWRSLFLTIDDGGTDSLRWFKQWPCVCAGDFNADGTIDFFDYLDYVSVFSSNGARADINQDGTIDFFDYLDFVGAFSAGC